jgi:hypothetical protein
MPNYSIRFPEDLYELVKAAAAEDDRSIHGEILWLLRRGLASR